MIGFYETWYEHHASGGHTYVHLYQTSIIQHGGPTRL